VPWTARLNEVADDVNWTAEQTRTLGQNPAFGPMFEAVQHESFRHLSRHSVDTLVELVKSRSYYLTSTAQQRAQIEAAVRTLAATHPGLAGRPEFDLPYVTLAYRARRT
jgi:hypothetical protein